MSGRNRRRSPADVPEFRQIARDVERLSKQVAEGYAWLHASGYTKPHAKAGEVGDPADLVSGTPKVVRVFLTRSAEALDDARSALLQAGYWLRRGETLIDETATAGGFDPELPEASAAEVRRAEQAQQKRNSRARQNPAPWAGEEITG